MRSMIVIEATSDEDEALMEKLGKPLLDFVANLGHETIMHALGRLKTLDARQAKSGEEIAIVAARGTLVIEKIPMQRYYEAVADLIDKPPELDRIGGRELAHWIPGKAAYPIMWLCSEIAADFHGTPLRDQQLFLELANEVLYGPDYDPDMLAEAWVWSLEDDE